MIRIDLVTFGAALVDARLDLPSDVLAPGGMVEYHPDLSHLDGIAPEQMIWPSWLKVRIRHLPDETD